MFIIYENGQKILNLTKLAFLGQEEDKDSNAYKIVARSELEVKAVTIFIAKGPNRKALSDKVMKKIVEALANGRPAVDVDDLQNTVV